MAPLRSPRAAQRKSSPRRAHRRAARSDAFLDAAMRIVARDGVDGLTMAVLADEIGAAKGALYRYFPGKDDLLAALQVRALDALCAELLAAAAGRRRVGALPRVVGVLAVVATLPDRDPPRHRLLDGLLSAPDQVYAEARARSLEAHLGRVLAVVEGALSDAAAAGAIDSGDAALRTRVLWACLHGAGHLRKRDRLEPLARRHRMVERGAVEGLLVGFGATRAQARSAVRSWPR